jgi:hypothetical protein
MSIDSHFFVSRYISPGGEEQAVFRNGTVITLFRDGRKETEFSNGQKETLCVAGFRRCRVSIHSWSHR